MFDFLLETRQAIAIAINNRLPLGVVGLVHSWSNSAHKRDQGPERGICSRSHRSLRGRHESPLGHVSGLSLFVVSLLIDLKPFLFSRCLQT